MPGAWPNIPKEAEIVGGSAEILINGTFRKQFQIYSHQKVPRRRTLLRSPIGKGRSSIFATSRLKCEKTLIGHCESANARSFC